MEKGKREQERLTTDRFYKAVEQLGNQEEAVRIGGIYSLEQIAKDSPKTRWTIMEVLSAYVRKTPPLLNENKKKFWMELTAAELEKLPAVSFDVQAVLTVIGRRSIGSENKNHSLDLRFSNLKGADLRKANLNLANLNQVYLYIAKLQEANLRLANLNGADLWGANLNGADLWGANLENADFSEVQGLTPEQVKSACYWEKAKYDKEFQKQLKSSLPVKGVDCSMWQK